MEFVYIFIAIFLLILGIVYIKDKIDQDGKIPFDNDKFKLA